MESVFVKIKEGISQTRWYQPGQIFFVQESPESGMYALLHHPVNEKQIEHPDFSHLAFSYSANRLGIEYHDAIIIENTTELSNENLTSLLKKD